MEAINQLGLIGRLTHTAFGYRDILILPKHKLLYALTTVPKKKLLKKPKTSITDDKGRTLHAGDVESWSKKKSEDDSVTNYQRLWIHHEKEQAQCLSWDDDLSYLFIGYSGGTIAVLAINLKMPLKYREVLKEKIHKDKVMGLHFDSSKGWIFSIGEDKYLRVYDVKNKTPVSSKFLFLTYFKMLQFPRVGIPF